MENSTDAVDNKPYPDWTIDQHFESIGLRLKCYALEHALTPQDCVKIINAGIVARHQFIPETNRAGIPTTEWQTIGRASS